MSADRAHTTSLHRARGPEDHGTAGHGYTISFMGANYVARQVGYRMTGGWGQGDRAASAHFAPLETFRARFAEIVADVRALGFEAMDVWTSHLSPTWATPSHLATAREVLDEHGLSVPSLGGWFGSTAEEFEATCRIAEALGASVLGGSTSLLEKDRARLISALEAGGLRLGVENHPEKSPAALRERLGEPNELIGVTVDTGWFGTQGYDAANAIEELADVLVYVHPKDVMAVGAHETCRFGAGIVPLQACVAALQDVGYAGALCVEHEPEGFDPTADVLASKRLLESWLVRP